MTRKRLTIIAIVVAVVIVLIILLPGYTKLQDLIAENNRLEMRIVELGKSVEALQAEKKKLENDILYIEKVAREKLGVAREDEVIIQENP